MQKFVCVLAILAAASTAAVANDFKQENNATVPAAAATQMTDSEMDKVTAGGTVTINGEVVTDRANGIEGLSMNTGPNPAGVLENRKGLFTLGPKQ
jgi:predicted nucleotidyltransferase